ncbi:HlyD family efflux transporter periplasmic adaptor subunit [Pigmentiphaga aceris]|uniref:HlyD family efflux transporter periplasmic adaptor subunit n=1 Tax=Pigmentiphaga aceris TaxID=1940612 RepID=A0A5C0B020_9BURK|nr:HlyD family efflux transporter periplasmic adaptor subunit [Pigmentiphaga aceris]QEI05967.1 HlyD family efflux transporter periplasmic adaptor subunit [Pigmentiphaga aceris]
MKSLFLRLGLRLGTVPLALLAAAVLTGCFDGAGARNARAAVPTAAAPVAYAAVARGKVDVEGGLLELGTTEEGQVESVAVKEGARVAKGDVLFHLGTQDAQLEVDLAQAELRRTEAALRVQGAGMPAARQTAQRLGEAARAGASDQQRADDATRHVQEIAESVTLAQADVAIARQRLSLARHRLERRTVRAPQAGTVLSLYVQPGSMVGTRASRPLMVLLPDRPLIVRAEVNESFVGRLKPGMRAEVAVVSDTRGAPIAGQLARVGQTFSPSRLDDDAALRANVRVVESVVVFTGPAALRIGQNVQVTFYD